MREAIKPGEQIMVQMGPGPADYQNEKVMVAGNRLIWKDMHRQDMVDMQFQMMLHRVGDVIYYQYIPMPTGDKLLQFLAEVAVHAGLSSSDLNEAIGKVLVEEQRYAG